MRMTNKQAIYLNGFTFDNNHVNLISTTNNNNNNISFKDFTNSVNLVAAAPTTTTTSSSLSKSQSSSKSLELDSVNNNSPPFHINHSHFQRVKGSNFETSAGVAIIKSEPIDCEGGDTKINKENDGEYL